MKRLSVYLMLCALAACSFAAANSYATERLRGIAKALGLAQSIESLPDGDYREGLAFASYPLHVIVEDSVVTHIGWSLPLGQESSPVFCFVERASLEKDLYKADALPAEWDCPEQAFYTTGDIAKVLKAGNANLSYTCANVQGRQYQVSWTRMGKVLCSMVFPINYELISGATLREMEGDLFSRLQSLKDKEEDLIGYGSPSCEEEIDGYIAVRGPKRPGSLLENTIYFNADSDEGKRQLVFDEQLPLQSLANALSTTTASRGVTANVRMMMYGANGHNRQFSMPLSALVGYFLRQGCTPYFGHMEGDPAKEEAISAAVKMVNPDLGYVHLMKVISDPKKLFGPEPEVDITLAAYVNDNATLDDIYD